MKHADPRLCRAAFVISCCVAASAAAANCDPVIAAYEKSGNEPRAEMFVGVGPSQPLGAPSDAWTGPNPLGQVAADLRTAAGKGLSKCTPAGVGDYRGTAVEKYTVQPHPASSGEEAHVVWIQKSTGLFVLEEIPDAGMFIAYRYPDAGR